MGNDFPLVHSSDVIGSPSAPELTADPESLAATASANDLERATSVLSNLAVAICDRRFGVGGDGLLALDRPDDALRLRMFNPDGTEDFCGNGLRCAAVHARALGWVGEQFVIRHLDREVASRIQDGFVTMTLPPADYNPERVPHKAFGELFNATVWSGMDCGNALSLFGSALTTGSTHTIIPTAQLPDQESFESVSARIEVDPLYPNRTSVIWSQEIAPDRLQILIWERGVGETLGCGTGASAAAADYLRRKDRGGEVFVSSKGGALRVRMSAWDAPIEVTGEAEALFHGEFRWTPPV